VASIDEGELGMTDRRRSTPQVVVVGSAMVDLVTYVDHIPRPGETKFATGFSQGFGGKGANQAAAAALHGATCSMVACVGDDLFGPATVADLEDFGVDTTHVCTVPGEATGTAAILVEPSGENRIALGVGANRCLDERVVSDALHRIDREGTARPAAVVSQLETSQGAAATAFEWGRAMGAATILTPGPPAEVAPDLLALCDWLVPNETELLAVLGLGPEHPFDDALRRAASFSASCEVGLVVTLGSAGAMVIADGRSERISAPVVDVRDTTGAGDAFAGAFTAALVAGETALSAATVAVAYASDSVTRPGTRASYRPAGPADGPEELPI
jgi:ribokinase